MSRLAVSIKKSSGLLQIGVFLCGVILKLHNTYEAVSK